MSLFVWWTRRSGGMAMVSLLSLSSYVVFKTWVASRNLNYAIEGDGGFWTLVFAYYCLLIHLLVFSFPLRVIWALRDLTRGLKEVARNKTLKDPQDSNSGHGPSPSLSSCKNWVSSWCLPTRSGHGGLHTELYADDNVTPGHILHAIIIPNYKEDIDMLRETLEVLASHPRAQTNYDVYLAMEQREPNVAFKAMSLISEFVTKFHFIVFTLHPSGIPGEAAGKGSNVAWAARKLSERYPTESRKDVLVTGIDADSHLSSDYFALVTSMHLAHPETSSTTLYSAPIIFDRNAHSVPAIVRVADILWCAGGISGLYGGSTISPPTSVYSLSLELVDRVGGWDCDMEAVGEDLHMYLKCFFALNGNLTTRTILSPVSQSNVTAGGGIIPDMLARYKQAQRHMWGALDSGFAWRELLELWQERKSLARAFRPLHASLNTNSRDSYVPQQPDNLNHEQLVEGGIFSDIVYDTIEEPNYARVFYLFHRLFEAHFLPVHATILILFSAVYMWVTAGKADIHGVNWIFEVCNYLRNVGFLEVVVLLFFYETFHKICLETLQKEMTDAGLAKDMNFSPRSWRRNFIDYFMVPLVAPIYGSIPCAQAQICHFWTVDLVYTVSQKATRQRSISATLAGKV
ncbi:glycosyl transferase family group 2-domain-containing protein [Pseudomassariella vexata]|uniref:Glycosyl transferase family group 2-domain-containing protein n=1 Tax=Pseudomassariella vexata TaxID=1141098 RepID=A0A1Y2EI73_9PEZI|nr:glycosyl transferase family group 2-domain-containing protein [Pseudomassariella vexata]ORY70994.1 glycosyl transferase family group 2-domain-containing protein [Pseudomassariella vexata]